MLRKCLGLLFVVFILTPVLPAMAHANLVRSEPPANTRLDTPPDELRIYFTEPLEAGFSQIEILNSQGEVLDLPSSTMSETDNQLLILSTKTLSDGIYTVSWRVVSQTDGHLTQGSFPFTIGLSHAISTSHTTITNETIPIASSVIRWINLFTLACLVGSIGFLVFVWYPAVPEGNPDIENSMRKLIYVAWLSVGSASILILLLQAQIVSGGDWQITFESLPQVILATRFGDLWIVRVILWFIFGFILRRSSQLSLPSSIILFTIGAIFLMTQSLFSHASGAVDTVPAVIADWLHLLAMSIWVGGLMQFIVIIPQIKTLLGYLALIVAYFSNMARLSVVILVITGTYAAWLHIGSLDALLTTFYGQAMLIKFLLFLPLLFIGAINLLLTGRGLRSGDGVWSKRLQYLIVAEIMLVIGVMGAVSVMTAISPARISVVAREAVPPEPETNTFFEMVLEDEMMIHLSVEPGYIGENTFYVDLFNEETLEIIDDASLIRLRFESEGNNLGESELRPELQDDGRYIVSGSNLSVGGDWRIRMTIQRPDEFDTVVDFEPTISEYLLPEMPEFSPAPMMYSRMTALIITGVSSMLAGALFLFFQRPIIITPQSVLIVIFIFAGIIITLNGLTILFS